MSCLHTEEATWIEIWGGCFCFNFLSLSLSVSCTNDTHTELLSFAQPRHSSPRPTPPSACDLLSTFRFRALASANNCFPYLWWTGIWWYRSFSRVREIYVVVLRSMCVCVCVSWIYICLNLKTLTNSFPWPPLWRMKMLASFQTI